MKAGDRVVTSKGTGFVIYVGWNGVDVLLDGHEEDGCEIFKNSDIQVLRDTQSTSD